jgi:type IV pilus assembly protein PilE
MKKLQKGFTLIELLVVIAIIGILSSVVLASLTSARSKGTDAAIQSAMSNMRAQAELYYSNWSHYGTSTAAYTFGNCTTAGSVFSAPAANSGLAGLLADVASKNGGTLGTSKVMCSHNANPATAWAVFASTTNGSYCVDSTGASKVSTGVTNSACN